MEIRASGVFAVVFCVLFIIAAGMFGCPPYHVWQQEMSGRAELSKAEYSKMVKVQEAIAADESAEKLADADIKRAKGAATANEILGDSLKNNEAYLRYLWIQAMREDQKTVVYVPTEANLPILEATRNERPPVVVEVEKKSKNP